MNRLTPVPVNIRLQMAARYQEALLAADRRLERWHKDIGDLQTAADLLAPHVFIRLGSMAAFTPRIIAIAETYEQVQAVCTIAEELQPIAAPQQDLDGNTVWHFRNFQLQLTEDI